MYQYSLIQWFFFFYLYCFIGWCFESTYVSVKTRRLTNRGFLRGPFLPIYGSGAMMMLVVSMPFQDNIVLTYLAGCVGATALEYATGVAMEALFKVRYWDYSHKKLNFQGHICLESTLVWGVFTILMTEFIHVRIESLVYMIPAQVLNCVTLALTAVLFADFALSFKAAIDLRNVLVKMEQAKVELVHIRKRLDVIIALTNEDVANRTEALAEKVNSARDEFIENISDLTDGIESRLEGIKELLHTRPIEHMESLREEWIELKTKYKVNLELRNRLSGLKDFFQRDIIRSNPTMTSAKFHEALEELKEKVSRRK